MAPIHMNDSLIVRYHEVALKGANRPWFVKHLVNNIRSALVDLPTGRPHARMGRIEVPVDDVAAWDEIKKRLERVFGIANFSLARVVSRDITEMRDRIVSEVRDRSFESFRVIVKRSDKSYPMNSMEVGREIGGHIKLATGARVDLDNGEFTVLVEIVPQKAYYSLAKHEGPGGLPVGTGGSVAVLLSGGIDSPVAAMRMMKRGCRAVFVHFHSVPFLDASSQEKARDLARQLTRFQYRSRLYLVPFGEIQRQIVLSVERPFRVVLYRRMMVRIAQRIAQKERCQALTTGECLGQVASQTIQNMAAIDEAAAIPILRPLVGMDKVEITAQAEDIGTFPISSLPDQDCCTLFVPRHPATKVSVGQARACEKSLNLEALIDLGIQGAEKEDFFYPGPPTPRQESAP